MLDAVKWTATAALIGTILVAIMGIFAPQFAVIAPNLVSTVSTFVTIVATPLRAARGLINFFFVPWSLPIVSFALIWMTTKPFQLAAFNFLRSIIKGIFS